MSKTSPHVWLAGSSLLVTLALVSASVVSGAHLSTSVCLFILGVCPVVVMAFLANNVAPPTVAEILYRANTTERGR
ncbi:MAG TPA: hypothetical protein VN628_14100 [Vicinamibacterales bacterium]|nr:hypothetical protein [Vicinamibacterales bacterium]